MNLAFGRFLFRDPRAVFALLAAALIPFLPGCASVPDVRPFTEATVGLRSAVASAGAATVAELGRVNITDAEAQAKTARRRLDHSRSVLHRPGDLCEFASSHRGLRPEWRRPPPRPWPTPPLSWRGSRTPSSPGQAPRPPSVSQTLAFVYEQIAKARATASLEKALAEVQPAIERVAQLTWART